MASFNDVAITQAGKFSGLAPKQLKAVIVLSQWYIQASPSADPTTADWTAVIGLAQGVPTMTGNLSWEESMSPVSLRILAAEFWQSAIQIANVGTAVANQTTSNILLAARYLLEMDNQTLERLFLYQMGKDLAAY